MLYHLHKEKSYAIAGLNVRITGKQTVNTIAQLPGFDLFEVDTFSDADIHIRVDLAINTGQFSGINPIHRFSVLEINHTLSIFSDGYLFEMCKQDGSPIVSIVYVPHKNEIVMSSCDDALSLKFAVWVAYSFVAVGKNIFPIHASAIVKDGQAVLFLGESGTGKSTHTGLWIKYINSTYLLNDDSPIVRIDGDRVLAYGSPWSGKTHCYQQEAVPLKAIVRLKRALWNKITPLRPLQSIGAIYPSCPPLFAYDKTLSGNMIGTIDKILTHTPVYTLECLPDQEAAEVAYKAIYRFYEFESNPQCFAF